MSEKKKNAARNSKRWGWKLYWCTTADGDEDWFVIARSPREAARFHENQEGYDAGDADAAYACDVPQSYSIEQVGWPNNDLLELVGRFLRKESPRVVEINGRVFSEGTLDARMLKLHDDRCEARGDGRPNGTINPDNN